MSQAQHWQQVYTQKNEQQMSWTQSQEQLSVEWIQALNLATNTPILDAGCGLSQLAEALLQLGYQNLTLVDLAQSALDKLQLRLAEYQYQPTFLAGDITQQTLPQACYGLWHDRAVFHFLTETTQQQAYFQQVSQSIQTGGHLLLATFADDGPEKCSGLTVKRYSQQELAEFFAPAFTLQKWQKQLHQTPFATQQSFIYCHFIRN